MQRIRNSLSLMAAFLSLAAVACSAYAQAPGGNYASVTASAKPASIKPSGHTVLAVAIDVAPGFHINAVKPADPYLIPTRLQMGKTTGFVVGPAAYPAEKTVRESYSPKPMLVYTGLSVIHVPVTASPGIKPGRYTLKGTVTFQGCNHSACFPPKTEPISVPITVK